MTPQETEQHYRELLHKTQVANLPTGYLTFSSLTNQRPQATRVRTPYIPRAERVRKERMVFVRDIALIISICLVVVLAEPVVEYLLS